MFDLFRSREKSVRILLGGLLLVVAFSMLTYLVPNYNTGATSGASDVVVAEIGKDTITLPELQQVIQMNLRGRQLPPEIMPHFIPQYIDSMINERCLAYEAQRLGFKVSDEELASTIRQTIPQLFPEGKFAGKEMYQAVLAQQNMTIPQFEADMTRQLLVGKLRNIAMEGAIVTKQEIEQEFRHRNDKIKVEYVKVAGDKLRDQVKPSPEEVKKYYESNKGSYQVGEKRSLGILVIDQAKLEQNIEPTDADLLRLYNDNKDTYRTPERVNIRHILLKSDGKDAKKDQEVKTKIEGLLKQARGGADFAELAKKNSEDPGSAVKGGEYDGVVRGQMVAPFEKAAFDLKPGQISDVVKTEYGYHIIQGISHESAHLKPFEEVKPEIAAEFKKQRVNDLMQQTADKAQAALIKDPTHPDKVAADLGIMYFASPTLGPNEPLPEIGINKDFQAATEALKKGEVSQAVPVTGNKIALAVCLDVIPAHPSAFEDVKDKAQEALVQLKITQLEEEKANQLAAQVKANGGDLAAAAKSMGFEMKESTSVDRNGSIEGLGAASTIADAFNKPVGGIVGPINVPNAKVVAKVIEKTPADMTLFAAQEKGLRDEIKNRKNGMRNSLFEEGVREALKKEGKVKIHQDVVDRLMASYQRS